MKICLLLSFWERRWYRGCGGDINGLPLLCSCPRNIFLSQQRPFSSAALTTVSSLGAAPCWSRTLMMCVCPCCAAWCSGVYPFCRHKGRAEARLWWAQLTKQLQPPQGGQGKVGHSPSFWR